MVMALVVADRSDRGKLRFSGEQDAWFLHQILTQDFESMQVGEARDAAQLTAHGRMVGYLEFLRTDTGFFAHFEPSLKETYPEQIQRYVFATRVEIADVSSEMGLILVAGDDWADAAGAVEGGLIHPTRSLGAPAGYVWVPAARTTDAIDALVAAGGRAAEEDELERIRISNGAPRWGAEMNTKTIPQEAGIDAWAIHFEKGCYVGQEAMAKIQFRGKVNRRLVRLKGEELTAGADVYESGTKVGRVTSAGVGDALAILKHTIEKGTELDVDGMKAEVVG